MRWLPRWPSLRPVAVGLLLGAIPALPASAYDPIGQWEVSTGESRYLVVHCQRDRLCAKLIWLRDDAKASKAAQYLNKYVVTGAIEVLPDLWTGALKYDGDVYQGTLTI